MAAQDLGGGRGGGVVQSAKGVQHGADAEQRPKVMQSAGRRRQDRVFVRGKIQRFFESKLTSARYGLLFRGRRSRFSVHQITKHRAADPNLVAWLYLLLRDRRSRDEGSVAAIQILQCASLAQSDEEAMAA